MTEPRAPFTPHPFSIAAHFMRHLIDSIESWDIAEAMHRYWDLDHLTRDEFTALSGQVYDLTQKATVAIPKDPTDD